MTWDLDGIRKYVIDLLDSSDTVIIGRKLAVDYIPYWDAVEKNVGDPMYDFAARIVKARKIVFTKTLEQSVWDRTELVKGHLTDEINKLKNQTGKDIIVYGQFIRCGPYKRGTDRRVSFIPESYCNR